MERSGIERRSWPRRETPSGPPAAASPMLRRLPARDPSRDRCCCAFTFADRCSSRRVPRRVPPIGSVAGSSSRATRAAARRFADLRAGDVGRVAGVRTLPGRRGYPLPRCERLFGDGGGAVPDWRSGPGQAASTPRAIGRPAVCSGQQHRDRIGLGRSLGASLLQKPPHCATSVGSRAATRPLGECKRAALRVFR